MIPRSSAGRWVHDRLPRSLKGLGGNRERPSQNAAGALLRVLIDSAIVAESYAMAYVLRFLLVGVTNRAAADSQLALRFAEHYVSSVLVLLVISESVFLVTGFYTYGHLYRSRYKVLVIAWASSLSFLLFITTSFVLFDPLPGQSRAVPFVAWGLATALLIGARVSAKFWRRAIVIEDRLLGMSRTEQVDDVLVIGGAGYIGSILTRQLLDAGYRVHILDSLIYGRQGLVGIESDPRVNVIEADSREIAAVAQAMRNVDAVVHLGEIVGDPACAIDEELTVEVNLLATRVLAEIAQGYGIRRFVYASSCSVYGVDDRPLTETADLHPVSLYARAKIASEQAVLALVNTTFSPTVLRFGTVYGWSHRNRFDLVVNLLAAKAARDGAITIFGGEQWRPFVHVSDAAAAIRLVLEAALPVVGGEVFNVGSSSENYSIRSLADLTRKVVPVVQVSFDADREDDRSYQVVFDKIRDRLHFEPRWTVEAGIRDIVTRLASENIDFRDPIYSNYRTFTDLHGAEEVKTVDSVFRQARLRTLAFDTGTAD